MGITKRVTLALLLALGVTAVLADGAGAWPWDPNVTVAGNTSGVNCPNLATVQIRLDDGQTRSAGTNWLRNYGGMNFRLGGNSIGATATVWCNNVTQPRLTRRVTVFRPTIGNQISINF